MTANMTINFPVRDAVAHADRFVPRGTRLGFYGLLVVTEETAILYDHQTDAQLQLDPTGSWHHWLPTEILPLAGNYQYFDDAVVCGWIRVEENAFILERIWSICIERDREWFLSQEHWD